MIYIASDHGGPELKQKIVQMLRERGEEVVDLGTNDTQSVDYPDYAFAVGENVVRSGGKGIVICKTGVGMSIAANKVIGVRCGLCTSVDMARLCRQHNDANVLAIGVSNTDADTALEIVKTFLSSEFEGGRHVQRVDKIINYEKNNG